MIIKKNIITNKAIQYVYGTVETNKEDQLTSHDSFVIAESMEGLNRDPSSLPVVVIKDTVRPFVLSLSDFKKFIAAAEKYETDRKLPSSKLSFKYLNRSGDEEVMS